MGTRILLATALSALGLGVPAAAAGALDVHVTDQRGNAVANAVVSLLSNAAQSAERPLATKAVIDQNLETFIPLVTILKTGGSLTFHNSDRTMHQVYSFAPIKQFEFEVGVGTTSPPTVFDKSGIAAIGCNIHDSMIAYVVVTDNPLTALSDASGNVLFEDLSAGAYQARVWQPDLADAAPANQNVTIGDATAQISFTVKLLPPRMGHSGHMGSY